MSASTSTNDHYSLTAAAHQRSILPLAYELLADRSILPEQAFESVVGELTFARLEWASDQALDVDAHGYQALFEASFNDLGIECRVFHQASQFNIGLICETGEHALDQVFVSRGIFGSPNLQFDFLASRKKECEAVANRHGVPFYLLSEDQRSYESECAQIIRRFSVDAVAHLWSSPGMSPSSLLNIDCPVLNLRAIDSNGQHCDVNQLGVNNRAMLVSAYCMRADANVVMPLAQAHLQDERIDVSEQLSRLLFKALNQCSTNKVMYFQNKLFVFD